MYSIALNERTARELPKLPFLFRNSTMSLNTMGIPQTICLSSLSLPRGTPKTHLVDSSGSETCVGAVGATGSGLTLAVGLRILTEDRSLCMERGHAAADSNIQIKLFHY